MIGRSVGRLRFVNKGAPGDDDAEHPRSGRRDSLRTRSVAILLFAMLAGLGHGWASGGRASARWIQTDAFFEPAHDSRGDAYSDDALNLEPERAAAQPPRAGIVIYTGRDVITACIALDGPEVSGTELLRKAGVELRASVTPLGTMICAIEGVGCPNPGTPCWCRCQSLGDDCRYWAYHVRENDGWTYSILGPAARTVSAGDVDGWAWGPGNVVGGTTPPDLGFEDICSSQAQRSPPETDPGRPPLTAAVATSAQPPEASDATPEASVAREAEDALPPATVDPSDRDRTARSAPSPTSAVQADRPGAEGPRSGPSSGTSNGDRATGDASIAAIPQRTGVPDEGDAPGEGASGEGTGTGAEPARPSGNTRAGTADADGQSGPVATGATGGSTSTRGGGTEPAGDRTGDLAFVALVAVALAGFAFWLRRTG